MFNHLSNSSTKSGVLGVPGTGTERILGGCWGSGSLFPSFSVWVANDFKFRPLNANCSADKRLGVGGEYQFSSVAQSCPTLCNPMNHSTPGLPVHHQLPEFTQTHVHWVSDAIQPSHPLSSPSPPALNFSQHQGLFKSVSSSHQVAKVLEFQLQYQSFQRTPRTALL